MMEQDNLFINKIHTTDAIKQKMGMMIADYNQLISRMNKGYVERKKINEDFGFIDLFGHINDFWDYWEFNKIPEKCKKNVELTETLKKVKEVVNKYNCAEKISQEELKMCYDFVKQIYSLSGYADDKQGVEEIDDEPMHW